jgi:hypothetical protein
LFLAINTWTGDAPPTDWTGGQPIEFYEYVHASESRRAGVCNLLLLLRQKAGGKVPADDFTDFLEPALPVFRRAVRDHAEHPSHR